MKTLIGVSLTWDNGDGTVTSETISGAHVGA